METSSEGWFASKVASLAIYRGASKRRGKIIREELRKSEGNARSTATLEECWPFALEVDFMTSKGRVTSIQAS